MNGGWILAHKSLSFFVFKVEIVRFFLYILGCLWTREIKFLYNQLFWTIFPSRMKIVCNFSICFSHTCGNSRIYINGDFQLPELKSFIHFLSSFTYLGRYLSFKNRLPALRRSNLGRSNSLLIELLSPSKHIISAIRYLVGIVYNVHNTNSVNCTAIC